MDILGALLDEVALEGLDGITIPALWLRLQSRVPPFPLLLDATTKQMLWQSLVRHPELEFYELPEERRPLMLINRYEGSEWDPSVLKAKDLNTEEIYPVHIINENKNGIQGSCQFFKQRILVSELVRKEPLTCEDAVAKWGEKLVIVASQTLRTRALIGWDGDPSMELPDCSYCMLEKIGRSRSQGEIQRDLQVDFKVEAGKVHYIRRALDKNGLVTMQTHVIKLPNGTQQHSLLLLLKRFHIDRVNKYELLAERVSTILSEKEKQMESLMSLREELGLPERWFKRLYYYMANAGIVKIISLPLHEIVPLAEHRKTKRGTDIMIRCIKLVKELKKKNDHDEDDDDVKRTSVPLDLIYEKDMLTQAYELIESQGTKGISQSEIKAAMNVGKLEARMLCRLLERYMLIKGFMEDEGRQRTTKYISHVFVEESELRRQFLEEKAKSEQLLLCNLAPVTDAGDYGIRLEENSPSENLQNSDEETEDVPCSKKSKIGSDSSCLSMQAASSSTPLPTSKGKGKSRAKRFLFMDMDTISAASENDCSRDSSISSTQLVEEANDSVSVIEEVVENTSEAKKSKKASASTSKRSQETYRLLKRRNVIVEAVKNLRLVESLFTLQKMIVEQERLEGVPTKCCKKSVARIVHKLSQEGLVRFYRTVVVQDGISKKVEFVVHPSINPNDPLVKSAIDQIRFRMSNSTSSNRTRSPQGSATPSKAEADEPNKENKKEKHKTSHSSGRSPDQMLDGNEDLLKNYHPIVVPGLGRSLGYLPKMPRLKITHTYLWYIVYGHPLLKMQQKTLGSELPADNTEKEMCDNATLPDCHLPDQNMDTSPAQDTNTITPDITEKSMADATMEQNTELVYADEETWKRCVPPATLHGEYGPGWVLVSDILLGLPLSVFIQIVQVSYKIDNLEDYLNDPIKKHTLIRHLPRPIRQQLLYKRRYVFSVFQGLQKLSCMGLVQFGPNEKFQDKDQAFVYIRKNATIVDTTACDPHYNIAQASHPFEKRSYHLETLQDVENFWFDLQFVCLNTPLGVVRNPHGKKTNTSENENLIGQDMDGELEERENMERKYKILESVPGSREVVDDGSIPGDGLGAGGLDSSFFSHLKRNWLWISYIVNNTRRTKSAQQGLSLRLQTFLNKPTLPLGSRGNLINVFGNVNLPEAGGELVQMVMESSAHRNERVRGGKNQRRKRQKKQPEKKKSEKQKKKQKNDDKNKRARYHDEADQSALQRMTRLRVAWTAQEDGLIMLCRIASNILNIKVKRPFVPWQVVRDIMHSNFEESLDKTSHSIGRRARYIIKNPQTYLNYKVCLAEVYQDEGLVEDFMNRKANYEDLKVCAAEYEEFVERLRVKFSTRLDDSSYEIPDKVEELFNRFRVLAVGDESVQESGSELLNSVDDIQVLVLQNLILSTLALSDMQMKSFRSLQTYRMYRQYHDNLLVKAFLEFQKKRLVNRRRVNHITGPKKNRALPFLPMSFQLSQTYYRLFIWRFPSTICTESFQFLEKLQIYGSADQPDVFSFGDQVGESALDMLPYPLDGPGGQCATVLSLLLVGFISVNVKIPDQIVVVDSTLVDNEVIKSLGKDGLDDDDFDDDEADENILQKRKIEVKAPQASHTNYLLMRGYCAPGIVSTRNLNPNDNVVVNSCQVHVKIRNTALNGRLKYSGSFIDFPAEKLSLPSHFSELLNTKDHPKETLLNYCTQVLGYSTEDASCVLEILSDVEASAHFGMTISDLGKRFICYEDVREGRTRALQQYLQDLVASRQLLQVGGASIRLVSRAHAAPWLLNTQSGKENVTQDRALSKPTDCPEPGHQDAEEKPECDSSIYEPPRKKAHLDLSDRESSADLEKTPAAASPGTTERVDVNTDESGDITAETVEIQQEKEPDTFFLGRPWRIVDGSLNKPVCKGMLEAILYQIMTKPGITEKNLLRHYSGVLQPAVIFELLQVLEQIGCIKKHYISKCAKATLFSKCKIPPVFENSKLSDDLTAFYEPAIDCTLRLGGMFPTEDNWNKWVL